MFVLAIDTALSACSAAVLDAENDSVVAGDSLLMERGHAERLIPLVEQVMSDAGLDFEHLSRIAVTVGPGSFTGLRVGLSAARGFGLTANRPVVGVTTLAALAAPFLALDDAVPVVSVIDARHGHVFLQMFGVGGRTLIAPKVTSVREAARAVGHRTGAPGGFGRGASGRGVAQWRAAAAVAGRGRGAGRRLGRPAWGGGGPGGGGAQALVSAGAGCQAAGQGSHRPAMMALIDYLFPAPPPVLRAAAVTDAAELAQLHGASFAHGWATEEFERMLAEPAVRGHVAVVGGRGAFLPGGVAGFVLSHVVVPEAEILSIAVTAARARSRPGTGTAGVSPRAPRGRGGDHLLPRG